MVIPENLLLEYFDLSGDELRSGKPVDFRLLGKVPLLLSREGGETRATVNAFLDEYGVTRPNILMETRDFEACYIMSTSGIGVTFSFNRYYRHFVSNYAQRYPLHSLPIGPRQGLSAVVVRHEGRYFSNTAKEFIRIARQVTETFNVSL